MKNKGPLFLFTALVFYGLFSSPTPEILSWAEILIGACLVGAIGIPVLFGVSTGRFVFSEFRVPAICFAILFFIPLIIGVLSQYPMTDILRDVIPLGYFFLPLFLAPMAVRYPDETRKALLYGLWAVGVLYALRFWPASHLTFARIGLDRGDDEVLYLSSSPAISFAGLYLFFLATGATPRPLWQRALLLILSISCLMTLVAILQRGAMILVLLVLWFYALYRVRQSPAFLILVLALGGAALFIFGDGIVGALETLWRKTVLVGDNARFAELDTVRTRLNRQPLQWLTGAGWGARVVTAASGHADVRYTHMLFSYTLLKGGLVGLGALAAYLIYLGRHYIALWRVQPLIAAAAFPPLFLGLTLYPSFKMLCFGAMLALVAVATPHPGRL